MSEPFVGEIRMFAGNFAPNGWLFCDGSVLSTTEYPTLYNLIGTTYGSIGPRLVRVARSARPGAGGDGRQLLPSRP